MYQSRVIIKKTRFILNNILDLGFPPNVTWRPVCLSYSFDGNNELPEEYARKDNEESGGKRYGSANLIMSLASSGKKEEAQQLYDMVKGTLPIPQFPEFLYAKANACLGKIEEAFKYLEKTVSGKSFWLFTLKYSPKWDLLLPHPRFKKVLERMNFPNKGVVLLSTNHAQIKEINSAYLLKQNQQ